MKRLIASTLVALAICVCPIYAGEPSSDGFVSLFDGKTLEGWDKYGKEGSVWEVKDGCICGSGEASMLVCSKGPFKNFKYRAEIKINDKGNSGFYFRTPRTSSFSDGYEAQIDSTHNDPIRTGSLYGFCHVYKRLVEPDTWFTYEVQVRDDMWRRRPLTRIKVILNGEELYEHLDFAQTYKEGYFGFQQHDPGSKVQIRKVEFMDLGDSPARK